MNNFVIQKNDLLFCKSHDLPIEYLSKTKDLPIQEILLCDACYRGKQQKTKNTVSIDQIYDLINLQFNMNNKVLIKQRNKLVEKFDLIHKNMNELWQKINKEFDDKLPKVKEMNKKIKDFCSKPQNYDLLQKIEEIKENNFIFDPFSNLNTISRKHQKYLELFFKNLISLFLELPRIFKDFQLLRQKQSELEIKKIKSEQPIKDYVELKDKQQSENNLVRAIAFTAKDSQMIAGSGKNIQIWKYSNGELQKDVLLKGHKLEVNALVVSKKEQWFSSGSIDGSILTWKQQNQQWSKNNQQTSHESFVTCLILNKDEDELLSSGLDKQIKVWKVNCQDNQIQLKYNLHAKFLVNWMTLNKSQSKLITFNMSCYIILWIKKDKWEESEHLKLEEESYKGCFIGENKFVIQTKTSDCLRIFSVADLKFTLIDKYNLQGACRCDDSLFRSIMNKARQILVHRCGKLIYFIKIQKEQKLEQKIHIECEDEKNFGILTKNDDYFVLWSQNISSFKIFKINYGA